MPQAADYDFSTPLQHPYQPPSQSYRPPSPPPMPPRTETKRLPVRLLRGVLFVLASSVVFGAVLFIAAQVINAPSVADGAAVIAGGGSLLAPGNIVIKTQTELVSYALSMSVKFVALSIACYYGVAVLITAFAGAKGRFR